MKYNKFIQSFVEKSSLSKNDSELLFLEIESDFNAKERDLILNKEENIMGKIEEDFGNKDKIANQMFLAHHRYLSIPILGPLLYFKTTRWVIFLFLYLIVNLLFFAFLPIYLSPIGIYGSSVGYISIILSYIPLVLVYYYFKTKLLQQLKNMIVFIVVFFLLELITTGILSINILLLVLVSLLFVLLFSILLRIILKR